MIAADFPRVPAIVKPRRSSALPGVIAGGAGTAAMKGRKGLKSGPDAPP